MTTLTTIQVAEQLKAACGAIAGVCDGARQRDDVGFNKADTAWGRYIATIPAWMWDAEQCAIVRDMLRKYAGQLAAAGIEWATLPEVHVEAGAPTTGRQAALKRFKTAQRVVDEAAEVQAWREGRIGTSELVLTRGRPRAWIEGAFAVLIFPYDATLVAAVKALPSRRFDGARKCWVVGRGSEAALATFLAEYAVIATLDVDAWIATPAPTPPPARRDNVRIDGNQIIVDAPYSPDATDAMRQVRGRRWLADRRVNSFPLSAAAEVAALARRFGWTGAEVADRIAAPAPAAPAAPQAAPRPAPAAEAPADLHGPPAGTWAATARAMARLFPDFDWDTWKDMHKEADCTA
jgi:hypothetical protein